MSTLTPRRRRASLAFGTAVALVATSLTSFAGPAFADGAYATVTGHESFSSAANKVSYWCPEGGTKVDPGGNAYVLSGEYDQVIVKAGSGEFANTIFAAPPTSGQIVWADTNGDGIFNPGGKGGDKGISHVILCDGDQTPPPTDLTVDKVWEYLGDIPDGFELGDEDAGRLDVTVDEEPTLQDWGQPKTGLPVGGVAVVSEGDVPDPDDPQGYICTISGVPSYVVNDLDPTEEAPITFELGEGGNTVVVTNSVECSLVEEPTTSLTVTKEWAYTANVPDAMKGLDSDNAGTLNVTVAGTATDQAWGATETGLTIGDPAVVTEEDDFKLPDPPADYTCEVTGTVFEINSAEATNTADFTLADPENGNTVNVVNTLDCTKTKPPTTSLTVTKEWAYTANVPDAMKGLDSDNAGTLNVTVAGTATDQAWGATETGLTIGDPAVVSEGNDFDLPTPPQDYTCKVTGTEFEINSNEATDSAEFTLIKAGNTVNVINTLDCTKTPPPPATTTLTVTKVWVGVPAGYTLTSADAGALTVTVDGVATGQAWNATQAGLKVGDKFTVTEGAVAAPALAGYTCEISGSPAYSVNGGAFVSPAPTGPLAPSPNTVVVQNTVSCTADDVVEGIEDGGEAPEEAPAGGTVAGTEDELAATGANLGPAGLGLLLILSGAALLGGRRFATR